MGIGSVKDLGMQTEYKVLNDSVVNAKYLGPLVLTRTKARLDESTLTRTSHVNPLLGRVRAQAQRKGL